MSARPHRVNSDGGSGANARRRLAVLAIAATMILVAGLALAIRRGGERAATGPLDDAELRSDLDGMWVTPYPLETPTGRPEALGGVELTFEARPGGTLALSGPCGFWSSRGYTVEDAHLVLTEPLQPGAGVVCGDRTTSAWLTELATMLGTRPALDLDGDTLFVGDQEFRWPTPPRLPTLATTTMAAAASTAALPPGARVPTLAELRGRSFIAQASLSTVTLEIASAGNLMGTVGCNYVAAPAVTIEGGRLVMPQMSLTMMGCEGLLAGQETAIWNLLRSRPGVSIVDGAVRISDGMLTLDYVPFADLQAVAGGWTVVSGIADGVRIPVGSYAPAIELRNGDWRMARGECVPSLWGAFHFDATSLSFTANERPKAGDAAGCPPTDPVEGADALQAFLTGGPLTYVRRDGTLTITSADGRTAWTFQGG